MSSPIIIHFDTQGTLERLQAQMAAMPRGVERARVRALRKLSRWIMRQALREAAEAAGTTQKVMKTLVRYRASVNDARIAIWIGTNPIGAHHLGTVRWTRRMTGARAGRRLFPGTWSWPTGRTAGLIMRRTGVFGRDPSWNPSSRRRRAPNPRLEMIDKVIVPVHGAVVARMDDLRPAIIARFQAILIQELNYALNVEAQRAAA